MTTVTKAVKRFTGDPVPAYGLLIDGKKFAPFFTLDDDGPFGEFTNLPEGVSAADALEPYYQDAVKLGDDLYLSYNNDPGTVEEI